jgi:broad specificity phosphatase PhoE
VTRLLFARHGETAWNREGRFQGHADPPLSDEGRHQAHELADRLADTPLAAIYTSDLARARETAEIVAASRGLAVHVVAGLRENDVGSWTGLTIDEIRERFADDFGRWQSGQGFGWSDGERYPEMAARVVAAVRGIVASHPDSSVLVVTHGGPLRAIRAHALGLDYETSRQTFGGLANCELCEVELDPG